VGTYVSVFPQSHPFPTLVSIGLYGRVGINISALDVPRDIRPSVWLNFIWRCGVGRPRGVVHFTII